MKKTIATLIILLIFTGLLGLLIVFSTNANANQVAAPTLPNPALGTAVIVTSRDKFSVFLPFVTNLTKAEFAPHNKGKKA